VVTTRKGFTLQTYEKMAVQGGARMQRLHEICRKVTPAGVFEGECLLVVAPESPENYIPATRINGKYCKNMKVVTGQGSHYTILQQDKAMVTASRCLSFFKDHGLEIPSVPTLHGNGIEVLREGGLEDPLVYLVHDVDGMFEGFGHRCKALAESLAPCHVRAVAYFEELRGVDHLFTLFGIYSYLIYADSQLYQGRPIILAGHGRGGCALAHELAVTFEHHDFPVSLLLFGPGLAEERRGRPDGFEWLGAELEALLYAATSLGADGAQWAQQQRLRLTPLPASDRDAGSMKTRLLKDFGPSWEGLSPEQVEAYLAGSTRNMDRLNELMGQMPEKLKPFGGDSFLLLPEEPKEEVEAAKEAHAPYYGKLEVVTVPGEPGTLLAPGRVAATAGAALPCVRKAAPELERRLAEKLRKMEEQAPGMSNDPAQGSSEAAGPSGTPAFPGASEAQAAVLDIADPSFASVSEE